jgi:hypothetical protein
MIATGLEGEKGRRGLEATYRDIIETLKGLGAIRNSCAVIGTPCPKTAEQLRPPGEGRSGGRYACPPQIGGASADEAFLPEHPIRVLLLHANVLRFGAKAPF